jgi:hypothetical protein
VQEVLEEGRVQADLEEWILKLEEIKRDIEARERLYSEFVREKKSWNHTHQKVTHHPATHTRASHIWPSSAFLAFPLSAHFRVWSTQAEHKRMTEDPATIAKLNRVHHHTAPHLINS